MIHAGDGGATVVARAIVARDSASCYSAAMSELLTYLFSGYARLPQDVSHQAMYKRVGVVFEVDDKGVVVAASTTLMMPVASEEQELDGIDRNVRPP